MAQPPAGRTHDGWDARAAVPGFSSSSRGTRVPPREPLASIDGADGSTSNSTWSDGRNGAPRPTAADNDLNGISSMSSTSSTAAAKGSGGHGASITLRCMYTNQKAKKRKVWSDGAVKCCPQRLRVCLHRWSDVIGVTDKLLGEVYLSLPEYQAFVTKGEPELEMELYMVSLDGVIEYDEPSSESALTNSTHSSRKRKLLKPFKPPTRMAPPPAPADDGWGPPGREIQRQRRPQFPEQGQGARREGQRSLLPRSSYTGFGQVESLSDDEEGDEGTGLGSVPRGAGWGVGAAEEYRPDHGDHHDGQMGSFTYAQSGVVPAMQSSGFAAPARMNDCTWEREDWRASDSPERFARDVTPGEMPSPLSQNLVIRSNAAEGPVRVDDHRPTRDLYAENCKSDWGGGAWPQSAPGGIPGQQGRAYGVAAIMDQRQQLDQHNDSARRQDKVEDEHFGSSFDSEHLSGDVAPKRSPELSHLREQEQTRSTQDIMSLFGGFGSETPAPPVYENFLNETPIKTPQQVLTSMGSRWRNEASPVKRSRNHGGQEGLQPESCPVEHMPGGGEGRAAEMYLAQKAASAAEEGGRVCEAFNDGGMDSADTVDDPAGDVATEWVCDVCGVRASPPLNVCRVCGNSRQVPESGGHEGNSDSRGLLPGGGADDSGDAGGVDDVGVDIVDRG